jgi:hypothetical protein
LLLRATIVGYRYQSPASSTNASPPVNDPMAKDPEIFAITNVNIARQSQTERQGRTRDENAADLIHVFGILAGIDDSVIGRGSHQHHDGQRDQK